MAHQGRAYFVLLAIATLTFSYYNWLARSTGNKYHWKHDLPGYYNYLGRAFAQGQLHLPMEPAKELLALKNPWDPAVNGPWRLHDGVLYKGRYYLYHGAGPALVLFAPWRILTGSDLPENFALVLLCFGAYLFLSGGLVILLKRADAVPGPGLLVLMLLVLAVGTGVPYLLIRIWVYELAIAGAYFGAAGGWFFLACGLEARRPLAWYVTSGVLFGIAMSSRPHVGIAGGACALLVLLSRRQWKAVVALAAPVVLSGLAVLAYNYARFDNALEFGMHYQLTGERNQQQLNPSIENLFPGVYYLLFCSPFVSPVFPFVRLFTRLPVITKSLPPGYFFEPTAGALLISPVLVGLVLLPVLRRVSSSVVVVALGTVGTALGAFLFVITIGLTTQRYQIDFVPLTVLAALVSMAVTIRRWRGARRVLLVTVFSVLSVWTIFANAGLAMSGPYDEILQRRPVGWMRIARWFSFVDEHTPLLNPHVVIAIRIRLQKYGAGLREPLIVLGHEAHSWMLYVEHSEQGIRLTSSSNVSTEQPEALLEPYQELTVRAEYSPDSRVMTTLVDGEPQIRHQLEALVLARSQLQLGRNDMIRFFTYHEFTGAMEVLERRIEPGVLVP